MRGFGVFLISAGLGLAIWGVAFDVTVANDVAYRNFEFLPRPADPDRVVNLDLLSFRIAIFIAAAAAFAGGCVLFAAGSLERAVRAPRVLTSLTGTVSAPETDRKLKKGRPSPLAFSESSAPPPP